MTYLDTHVVVWLFAMDIERISQRARQVIEDDDLVISPMVVLELEYLYEVGRLTVKANTILAQLKKDIGLDVSQVNFSTIIQQALDVDWTRDAFDRIIVAEAAANAAPLISKDRSILKNYANAVW
jgi:PIN domain nuclease of toxin-antitoxin system